MTGLKLKVVITRIGCWFEADNYCVLKCACCWCWLKMLRDGRLATRVLDGGCYWWCCCCCCCWSVNIVWGIVTAVLLLLLIFPPMLLLPSLPALLPFMLKELAYLFRPDWNMFPFSFVLSSARCFQTFPQLRSFSFSPSIDIKCYLELCFLLASVISMSILPIYSYFYTWTRFYREECSCSALTSNRDAFLLLTLRLELCCAGLVLFNCWWLS